jgi:hypothetical protein
MVGRCSPRRRLFLGARQKLNDAYGCGILLISLLIAGALQSWLAFLVVAGLLMMAVIGNGGIRPSRRRGLCCSVPVCIGRFWWPVRAGSCLRTGGWRGAVFFSRQEVNWLPRAAHDDLRSRMAAIAPNHHPGRDRRLACRRLLRAHRNRRMART